MRFGFGAIKGPRLSDYDGDRDAYESASCRFEADEDAERERQREEREESSNDED